MDVSSLFPHLGNCVDDMAFVRSVQTENGNHPAAVFLMNTGVVIPGKPSLGGLGDLWPRHGKPEPAGVRRASRLPLSSLQRLAAMGPGFLPASYQGTVLRWKGDPILNLKPPAEVTPEAQSSGLELLREYNQEFLNQHSSNPDLQGRIDAYELAYRMQAEVPGVLDITGESQETLEMYGLNDPVTESFGKRCLMARKLVEKGVRFVQLYTPSQSWDGHTEIGKTTQRTPQRPTNLSPLC